MEMIFKNLNVNEQLFENVKKEVCAKTRLKTVTFSYEDARLTLYENGDSFCTNYSFFTRTQLKEMQSIQVELIKLWRKQNDNSNS